MDDRTVFQMDQAASEARHLAQREARSGMDTDYIALLTYCQVLLVKLDGFPFYENN